MSVPPRIDVRIGARPLDVGAETVRMEGRGEAGALVTFVGFCRDEGGRLRALELEHYPGMAEREIGRIAAEAAERFGLLAATVAHRHGTVHPGEVIVFVGCSAGHRAAAFDGAAFLMDYLKSSAPFWKREHLADGTVGGWVEAKTSDADALDKWARP
jgi:molybdopterin synthase catalytic subunit